MIHLNAEHQCRVARRGAIEEQTPTQCVFWEPFFGFQFSSQQLEQVFCLVSQSSVVCLLLTMQSSINENGIKSLQRMPVIHRNAGTDGPDGSKSLLYGQTTMMSALSSFS